MFFIFNIVVSVFAGYLRVQRIPVTVRVNPSSVLTDNVPDPRIARVLIDKGAVELGGWVIVTVNATNYGYRADEMYISVSLPENPPLENIEIIGSDLQSTYKLGPGDKVWGDYGKTYPITLQYPLVEGYKWGWEKDETRYLKFKFKPHKTGIFQIYVKTTAQTGGQWRCDPTSGTKDQQNEYVYVYQVQVVASFNWDETLSRFVKYKEMYQLYRQSFFNSTWWYELSQKAADAIATYDFYKESVDQFVDTWLEYFEVMTGMPISPLHHLLLMKDLAESLLGVYNLYLSWYLDYVSGHIGLAYSRYDIRDDLDLLIAKVDNVIQALRMRDSYALTSALHELCLVTEKSFEGSKNFDDAVYDEILSNPTLILPLLKKTNIYVGIRWHILSFRETLMLSYSDITSLQGKIKSLSDIRPGGILNPRFNLPVVQDAYWEVNGRRVTEAQKGQEVKAHIIIRTLNISSVDYDMVQGSITLKIKKDIRYWFDQEYAKKTWDINLNPGKTTELVLSFVPDKASSITLRGYFMEVIFSGEYLFPNNLISDLPVDWDDGSKGAMKNSYPPRLKVSEPSGTSQNSGTVVILTETQHRLYLHIYDENGRHVGLNHQSGAVENQISGCSYHEFDNGVAIVLPLNLSNFRVVVDAKYAQEENESYELTVITVKDHEVIDQKSITGSIKKGAQQAYTIQIGQEGEAVIIQAETAPWWVQHQLWIIAGVVVTVATATATVALIRKRKKYRIKVNMQEALA